VGVEMFNLTLSGAHWFRCLFLDHLMLYTKIYAEFSKNAKDAGGRSLAENIHSQMKNNVRVLLFIVFFYCFFLLFFLLFFYYFVTMQREHDVGDTLNTKYTKLRQLRYDMKQVRCGAVYT
jgi:hypothetical protein